MSKVELKLSDIRTNPNNPRLIKDDKFKKLCNSIKEFPKMMELRPLVVDKEGVILGGNMRYKALKELGYTEIPNTWVKLADELTDEEKKRFIVEDNLPFGEWDFDALGNNFEIDELLEWGFDEEDLRLDPNKLGTDFSLPDGDKAPFQQMTFTLADEQAEQIKNAITDIKQTDEYKYVETMGNENSNGNALYLIIRQWAEQKK